MTEIDCVAEGERVREGHIPSGSRMLIEALRNGVRRTAKPRLLFSRRVSTSSTKNLLHPLLVLRLPIECLETDTTTLIFGKTRKCIVDCAVRAVPTDHR